MKRTCQEDDKRWTIAQLPLILSLGLAFFLIVLGLGGGRMENLWWISIVVALIGVAGSLLANYLLFKRDSLRFQKDSQTLADVNKDTTLLPEMKEDTRRTKEVLCEEILPSFRGADNFLVKINKIFADVDRRKTREESNSLLIQKDLSEVYATLGKMEEIILSQANSLQREREKNALLKREIELLRKERKHHYEEPEGEL